MAQGDNNPIKYSDLVQPDNSITDLIKQLDELGDAYQNTLKNIKSEAVAVKVSLEQVSGATTQNQNSIRKASRTTDELSRAMEKLQFAESERAKRLEEVRRATNEQNTMNRLATRLAQSQAGSYNALSAQYSINKIVLNDMTAEYRRNSKEGRELEKQTKDIYEEMKSLQEATGMNQLNVGNYADATKNLGTAFQGLPGPMGRVVNQTKALGTSLKALLVNPVVLTVVALTSALTALVLLFKRTEKGADDFARAGAYLRGTLSALTGMVDNLRKGLVAAFKEPEEALRSLWDFLKTSFMNQIKGFLNVLTAVQNVFIAMKERDLPGLKQAAKDVGTALVQMATGMDAEQQRDFAEAVRETTASINAQAQAFADLTDAQRAIRRGNRELERQLADLTAAESDYLSIIQDTNKTAEEREEAAARAGEIAIKRGEVSMQIARNNLGLLDREIKLRRANGEEIEDLLDQQVSAYQALRAAETDYSNTLSDNERRRVDLETARINRELKGLLGLFRTQRRVADMIVKDDERTFEERQKHIDERNKNLEKAFAEQIALVQRYTKIQIDGNDLIQESDAVLLQEKIRGLGLSLGMEKNLTEVIRERMRLDQQQFALQNWLDSAREKAAENEKRELKRAYDARMNELKALEDIANLEIDLMTVSERKKTALRLKAEKDRLKGVLAINAAGNKQLMDQELQAIRLAISVIDKEIRDNASKNLDIYEIFGLDLDDDKKQAISTSVGFAIDSMNQFLRARIDAANKAVEAASREMDASRARLDAELDARASGYANNVAMAQKELDQARKTQAAALREQEKAARAERAIQTAQQATNLVTASSKIWGQLGFPFAIPALAVMWGSFAYSKIKAAQMTRQGEESYGEGTVELLGGGSHQSGNDVDLGTKPDGTRRRAEGGEYFAVINKRNSRKYRSVIPDVVKSLNNGTFGSKYSGAYPSEGLVINVPDSGNKDLRELNKSVREINERGRKKTFVDGRGRLIETYKNLKRVHKN